MSDDHLDEQLQAYATHVQNTGRLPSSTEIRGRAHRRRQRQVAAGAFGVVLVGVLSLGLGLNSVMSPTPPPATAPPTAAPVTPRPGTPAATTPAATPSPSKPPVTGSPKPSSPSSSSTSSPATTTGGATVTSNVSQLRELGIDLNASVLIDVADDGEDRYLAVGPGGTVDFTGTAKDDDTMMSLKPARVRKRTEATKNRVVIAPPFYNEDVGTGSCVADVAPGELRLATCSDTAADQIWQVVPAGDSGQFELHGVHTEIRVDQGRIVTSGQGRVGLQTIPFTR